MTALSYLVKLFTGKNQSFVFSLRFIVDQKISAPPKSFLAHEYLPVSITLISEVGVAFRPTAVRSQISKTLKPIVFRCWSSHGYQGSSGNHSRRGRGADDYEEAEELLRWAQKRIQVNYYQIQERENSAVHSIRNRDITDQILFSDGWITECRESSRKLISPKNREKILSFRKRKFQSEGNQFLSRQILKIEICNIRISMTWLQAYIPMDEVIQYRKDQKAGGGRLVYKGVKLNNRTMHNFRPTIGTLNLKDCHSNA